MAGASNMLVIGTCRNGLDKKQSGTWTRNNQMREAAKLHLSVASAWAASAAPPAAAGLAGGRWPGP